jgi:hypothetical protein|tara:strand:+ start:1206 stop:2078 length:873 start_codon:yes stop_codon:yes gene_type:complete
MAESIYTFLIQDALSTGAGSRGNGSDVKEDFDEEKADNRRTNKKSLQQQIGIQVTLAAMLKQSSIFTGTLGALFQIIGAFVDILLMGTFPLLKVALKFIMKFAEPLKDISKAIGQVVDFVIKLFTKVGDIFNTIRGFFGGGPGSNEEAAVNSASSSEGAGLMQTIGNILKGGQMKKGGFLSKMKLGPLGTLMRLGSGAADFGAADDAAGRTTAIVQTAVGSTLAGLFGLGGATFGSVVPVAGTALGGAGGAMLYEAAFASTVDNAIASFVHGMLGSSNDANQYAGVPPVN